MSHRQKHLNDHLNNLSWLFVLSNKKKEQKKNSKKSNVPSNTHNVRMKRNPQKLQKPRKNIATTNNIHYFHRKFTKIPLA